MNGLQLNDTSRTNIVQGLVGDTIDIIVLVVLHCVVSSIYSDHIYSLECQPSVFAVATRVTAPGNSKTTIAIPSITSIAYEPLALLPSCGREAIPEKRFKIAG
jgi:hypothetical protein